MTIKDARAVIDALTDPQTLYVFGVIAARTSTVGVTASNGLGGVVDTVRYELEGHVVTITYHRPDKLNVLSFRQIIGVMKEMLADQIGEGTLRGVEVARPAAVPTACCCARTRQG